MMKEIKLPSGAILKIGLPPFEVSLALKEALLEEAKVVAIESNTIMAQVYKDLFCIGFSSKKIKAALWDCFKHCQYCDGRGELKIDKDTFEPVAAREDYMTVCMEVAKENVHPFLKSLYAEYGPALQMILNARQ